MKCENSLQRPNSSSTTIIVLFVIETMRWNMETDGLYLTVGCNLVLNQQKVHPRLPKKLLLSVG